MTDLEVREDVDANVKREQRRERIAGPEYSDNGTAKTAEEKSRRD